MSSNHVDSTEPITTNETRDTRFKTMLQQQFGDNGIVLMVNQSFLFIMALIMVISIIIGFIFTRTSEFGGRLVEPALVLKST